MDKLWRGPVTLPFFSRRFGVLLAATVATAAVLAGPDALAQLGTTPTANPDSYSTAEDTTLEVTAPGVLENDSDPNGDQLTAVLDTDVSNGTLTLNNDGSFSYTPDADYNGPDSFTYHASDGLLSSDAVTVSLDVTAENDAPTATGDSYSTAEDTTLDVTAPGVLENDSDPDGDALTAVLDTGVSNGTLTLNADGSFSYTPDADYNGPDSFTYHASDGSLSSATVTVDIDVTASNDPPSFTSTTPTGAAEDTTYTYDVTTTDPDAGDTLAIMASTLPGWLTLADHGDGTATLSGTPTNDDVGDHSVSLQVTDGTASATQSFTISVSNTNDPPSFTSTAPTSATQDQTYTYEVTATDPDADDTLTITAPTLPDWLDLTDHGDGTTTVSGTPGNDDVGDHSVSIEVSDESGETALQDFTISVGNVNDAPEPADDAFTAAEDSTDNVIDVLANDKDPDDDTLTIAAVGMPDRGGAVSIAADGGTLTYSPAINFAGIETFAYTAEDLGGETATATVTVTVTNSNDAPRANDDHFSADEDVPQDLDVLANDTDLDEGDTLTITSVTAPDQGPAAVITDDGSAMSYTPPRDFSGTETFEYTVEDASGAADTARVTVTVSSVNDPPSIEPDPIPEQTITENVPMSLDLAQFVSDIENDPLSFALAPTSDRLPDDLTLDPTGVLSGTPALDVSVGKYGIVFEVSDGEQTTTSAPFMLTVLRAGRVDLAVSISTAPNPATVGERAAWRFSIRNNAPDTPVPSTRLEATVTGQAPFVFDTGNDPACTITPMGNETQIDCTLLDPIPGGGTATIELTGSGNQAGDVVMHATVAVAGAEPVDETPRNDSAAATLSIAQGVSITAAQQIDNITARASAAGDLDGDGFDDLAVAALEGTYVVLNVVDPAKPDKRTLSDSPVTLSSQGGANGVAIADLDGDGDLDIVTAGGSGRSNEAFVNSGSATFTRVDLGETAANGLVVVAGDVNGDAYMDLFVGNTSASSLYLNTGAGAEFAPPVSVGDGQTRDAVLVDLFGNALPELVLANGDGKARIFANTAGGFVLEIELETGPTTSVASADFNGDGLADLVFGRDTTVSSESLPTNPVYSNTSAGSGSFFLAAELGASPTLDVVPADTDLDGNMDLVFVNRTGAHQIYLNTGGASGGFVLHAEQIASVNAVSAATGSLSVDDRLDLAVASDDGVGVFYNDGAGNLGLGDTEAPILELRGQAEITVTVGSKYVDRGATATDATDGNLNDRVVVDNPVNTSVIGTYTVRYSVTDLSGNSAVSITRRVRVQAREPSGAGGGGAAAPPFVVFMLFLAILARLQHAGYFDLRRLRM